MQTAVKMIILFGGLAIGGLFGFWLARLASMEVAVSPTAAVDCDAIADDNLTDSQKLGVLLRLVRTVAIQTDPKAPPS